MNMNIVTEVAPQTTKQAQSLVNYMTEMYKQILGNDAEIEINAQRVDEIIHSVFYSGGRNRYYFVNRLGDFVTFGAKDAFKQIFSTFGCPVDMDQVERVIDNATCDDEGKKAMKAAKYVHKNVLSDFISLYCQKESIEMAVDMFASKARIELLDESARIVFKHKPFNANLALANIAAVQDFKQHFPELDQVLSMIVAARFASDRKKAYLWMHCESDWGKGFLIGCLSSIGAVIDLSVTEVEKIFSGSPVGRSMADFKRAIVLSIDEFKNVKSEVKQLQNEMTLSPKNQLSVKVQIYTKLFTSAESVSSLANGEMGIEDQFANRFNLIRGQGSLEHREAYSKIGKFAYFEGVKFYVASTLNRMIDDYVRLGMVAATRQADDYLSTFYQEHRIDKQYERFSDSLPNLAESIRDYFIEQKKAALRNSPHEPEAASKVIHHDDGYYLKSAGKAVGDFLKANFDGAQLCSLNKKKADLYTLMSVDGRGTASHRLDKYEKAIKLK
ncbi:hypothetical protein ACPV5S_20145 [Vibrio astriarenae]